MIWSAMQINRGGCHPPRPLAYLMLHIIRKPHSIFYYSFKICKFLTTLPPRRLSANHLPLSYPGCKRLFMCGFRFRSSLKKWPARKVFSRGFAARVFGLRPTKRSSLSHARKNLWYPGYLFLGTVSEFTEDALSCRYSSKRRWHSSSIILAYSCIRSFSFNKKFTFFSSSDSRKLFQHFFKVYFCINISVAAPLPENEVAILLWDNIPYLHFSNTVRAGWVWFMNK